MYPRYNYSGEHSSVNWAVDNFRSGTFGVRSVLLPCLIADYFVQSPPIIVSTLPPALRSQTDTMQGIIFSAVMVRASREHRSNRTMTEGISLQTHRSSCYTTYTDQRETIPRNAGEINIGAGETVQVPSASIKRSLLTFHIPTSPYQASRVDAIKIGH